MSLQSLETFPSTFQSYIDFKDPMLYLMILHILFNPIYWTITSTIEFKTRFFRKLWCGNKCLAVIAHGLFIFLCGLSRNFTFKYIVETRKHAENFPEFLVYVGYIVYGYGILLVTCSTYQLGIFGTFNGDAYGYLLPGIITSFPFNVSKSPMYDGSSLNFLGHALINKSPVGIFFSVIVYLTYKMTCIFEDKLTEEIYSKEEKDKKVKNVSSY